MDDKNFTQDLAEITDLPRDKIVAAMDKLGLDEMIEIIGALRDHDTDHAKNLLMAAMNKTESDHEDEDDIDTDGGREDGVLHEQVLGMTGVPMLDRLRALAGLPPRQPDPEEVEIETVAPSATVEPTAPPSCLSAGPVDTSCPLTDVMSHFDAIEAGLGNLRLSDGRTVRERVNQILQRLNEGAQRRRK